MVKDLRTGYSTSDTQGVLTAKIDPSSRLAARWQAPAPQPKDIRIDD